MTVRLGAAVDAAQLIAAGFESVVVATGVTPRTPPIEGVGHAKVLSYVDVLKRGAAVGARVAVVGAGGVGFDVAEFLAHGGAAGPDGAAARADDAPAAWPQTADYLEEWGIDPTNERRGGLAAAGAKPGASAREVFLLQRTRGKLGAGLGKTTGWIHRANLTKKGVTMIGGVTYERVDDAGLHVSVQKGKGKDAPRERLTLDVDHVVLCAGQDKLDSLVAPLAAAGVRAFVVGGAERAGELDAKRAIDQGTRLAAVIEDARPGDVFEAPVPLSARFVEAAASFMTSGRK